jgi:hypothetical protein
VTVFTRLNARVVDHSAQPDDAASGDFTSSTFTTVAGSLLVAVVTIDNQNFPLAASNVPTPTTSGTTWTLAGSAGNDSANYSARTRVYMADSPGAGSSNTFAMSSANTNWDNYVNCIDLCILEFPNALPVASQTSLAINQTYNGSGAGRDLEALSVTLSAAPASTSWTLTAFAGDGGTSGATPGTGFTEIADRIATAEGYLRTAIQLRHPGSTSTQAGWVGGDLNTDDSTNIFDYSVVALEIKGRQNVIVVDDFNRANGALAGSNNWAAVAGASDPGITSNAVTTPTGSWAAYAASRTESMPDNGWIEADISTTGQATAYLYLRINQATGNGYAMKYSSTSQTLTIERITGGAYTTIATLSSFTGNHRLRFEAVDSRLTVYSDGVEVLSQTDANHTGGYPPVFMILSNVAGQIVLDNFSAGDWTTPGTTTKIRTYRETADFTTAATSKSITTSWAEGDIILWMCQAGGDIFGLGGPTHADLTFQQLGLLNTPNVGSGGVWWAKAPSTKFDQVVSQPANNWQGWGASCWVIKGNDASKARAILANRTAGGTASVAVKAGASLFGIFPDWDENNLNDTPKTGSGTVTERRDTNGGSYDQYVVDWENVSSGTFDFGYSATTGDTNFLVIVDAPDVVATDDFNRANATLTASSPDWASTGAWPTPSIVSNKVRPSATGVDQGSYWSSSGFANDQWVEFDVDLTGVSGYSGATAWVRRTADNAFYAAEWADGGTLKLFVVTPGSGWVQIGATVSGAGLTGRLRLEAVGSRITVFKDGVQQITQTDATHTTGRPAFHIFHAGGTAPSIDNFSAGDWEVAEAKTTTGTSSLALAASGTVVKTPRLVASTQAGGVNGGTTPSIDTTGATFLVLFTSSSNAAGLTVSDSKGNTWIGLTAQTGSEPDAQIWYAVNPTVGTGHTFTVSGTTTYSSIAVQAHAGVVVTQPFDGVQNGTVGFGESSPVAAGSVTPSGDGYLVIAGFAHNAFSTTVSIDSSFTKAGDFAPQGAVNYGVTLGYLYQGTAAAVNPQFSWTGGGTTNNSTAIAVFRTSENVVATDNFNRANGGLGSNWVNVSGDLAGQIVSNQLVFGGSGAGDEYGVIRWAGAGTFDDDQWCEVTFTLDGTNLAAGVTVRETGSNRYEFNWRYDDGGKYQIVVSGFEIAVVTGVGSTGTRTLRLEAVGTRITGYVNGVQVLSVTNDWLATGADVGLTGNAYYSSSTVIGDNFSAGDWGSDTPGPVTGATSVALAASGSISGRTKNVTGTSSLVLSASGTASQNGVVTGAASVALAASGTDVKAGTATAAASVTFGASGTVVKGASDPPGTITDLAATAGDTQAVLTWTAPSDGGSAITDYIVEYRVAP